MTHRVKLALLRRENSLNLLDDHLAHLSLLLPRHLPRKGKSRGQVTRVGHEDKSRGQFTRAGHEGRSRGQVTRAGHEGRSRGQATRAGDAPAAAWLQQVGPGFKAQAPVPNPQLVGSRVGLDSSPGREKERERECVCVSVRK